MTLRIPKLIAAISGPRSRPTNVQIPMEKLWIAVDPHCGCCASHRPALLHACCRYVLVEAGYCLTARRFTIFGDRGRCRELNASSCSPTKAAERAERQLGRQRKWCALPSGERASTGERTARPRLVLFMGSWCCRGGHERNRRSPRESATEHRPDHKRNFAFMVAAHFCLWPWRAHSSPRHACGLHGVLFLHCLQHSVPRPRVAFSVVLWQRPALRFPARRASMSVPVAVCGRPRKAAIFQVTTGKK